MEAGNLTVVQLSREYDGVYECIASNHIANVVTYTLLIIERKTNSQFYESRTAWFVAAIFELISTYQRY